MIRLGRSIGGELYACSGEMDMANPKRVPINEIQPLMHVPVNPRAVKGDLFGFLLDNSESLRARLEETTGYTGSAIGVLHSPDTLTIYAHDPKQMHLFYDNDRVK